MPVRWILLGYPMKTRKAFRTLALHSFFLLPGFAPAFDLPLCVYILPLSLCLSSLLVVFDGLRGPGPYCLKSPLLPFFLSLALPVHNLRYLLL